VAELVGAERAAELSRAMLVAVPGGPR
jgi:hypothetical protein